VRTSTIDFRTAEHALINGLPVWWIETGDPGRQRDDIHLFSRDGDDGTSEPYVECSSCHDPHTESRMFLRHVQPQGFICVTCHIM
jgi:predicted CXXCH cytochrome family protein